MAQRGHDVIATCYTGSRKNPYLVSDWDMTHRKKYRSTAQCNAGQDEWRFMDSNTAQHNTTQECFSLLQSSPSSEPYLLLTGLDRM